MPATIYDSSLVTHRRRVKTVADSFISRIQNLINPTTGYAPALGIWDQSIINSVNDGQMKYFRKNEGGCTIISNGCPCEPLPNVTLYPPGAIPYVNTFYSSVIVEWGEPISGTKPFTYIVYAIRADNGEYIMSPPTTNRQYIFQTDELMEGIEYNFKVIASNSGGTSDIQTEHPIPAPYGKPSISSMVNSDAAGSIIISINSTPFNPLSDTAEYNIITYLDNVKSETSPFQPLESTIITLNNLQSSYLYSFKVQIKDSDTELSSYSNLTENRRPIAGAPQNVEWSALSTTSIRVAYNNFLEEAGGFNLIGATCIISNGYSLYLNTENLTNTSVDIIELSPHTTYYDFTLQFVYGNNIVNSGIADIPTFTTL